MIKVFIPTRDREHSSTGQILSAAGVPFTYVLTENASITYPHGTAVSVPAANIGQKRQAILEIAGDHKFAMLDDDLLFYRRSSDTRFEKATPDDVRLMIDLIDAALDYTAAAGIIPKFMSQNTVRGLRRHGRMDQVLAYNPALMRAPRPTFRAPVAEEHDFNLQVMAQGHVPIVFTEFAKGDRPYNKGGCSAWRTPEVELAGLRQVADAHGLGLYETKNAISGYRLRVPWAKLTPPVKDDNPTFDELMEAVRAGKIGGRS